MKSAVKKEDYPKFNLPQITFAGRSNVGKSSLINTIIGRKNLARTSSTPGKTRTINFYLVNKKFYFVDLPGYGYAKVPERLRQGWRNMLNDFFQATNNVLLSFVVLDCRRDISDLDLQMIDWLRHYKIKTIFIITKIDKLSTKQLNRQKDSIIDKLPEVDNNMIVFFSAKTGAGKKEILKFIGQMIGD